MLIDHWGKAASRAIAPEAFQKARCIPWPSRGRAFREAHVVIENRIKLFVVLPIEKLDGIAIKRSVDDIGRRGAAPRLELS